MSVRGPFMVTALLLAATLAVALPNLDVRVPGVDESV
jgi:hypothetical protein